jgi:hypothetical protein
VLPQDHRGFPHASSTIAGGALSLRLVKSTILTSAGTPERPNAMFMDLTLVATVNSHPAVLMVQSAQDRSADDIAGPLNAARNRGILVQ